jgi:hypothetical protein
MKISTDLEIALSLATKEAARHKHEYVTLEHLLVALLCDRDVMAFMATAEVDVPAMKKKLSDFLDQQEAWKSEDKLEPAPTNELQRLIRRSAKDVMERGEQEITCQHVLERMFNTSGAFAEHLLKQTLVHEALKKVVDKGKGLGHLQGEDLFELNRGEQMAILSASEEAKEAFVMAKAGAPPTTPPHWHHYDDDGRERGTDPGEVMRTIAEHGTHPDALRPDFASFAKALRAELRWSAELHTRDKTGHAASDQKALGELAEHVERVGKRLGFM